MLLSTMYRDLLFAMNSDLYGGSLQIDEFNYVIKLINEAFVKDKWDEYVAAGLGRDEILSTKLMTSLTTSSSLTFTTGSASLPADFLFYRALGYGASGSQVPCDLVEPETWVRRQDNTITGPTTSNPMYRLDGTTIKVLPATITTGTVLYYIKEPTTPYLDYYIDASDNKVFLDAGDTDVAVPEGGTTSGGVAGATTVDSSTAELSFDESNHAEFFTRLLNFVAMRNRDTLVFQGAESREMKEKE